MTARYDHYTALEVVKKDASFDDWQEENAVGHIADVYRGRGNDTTVTIYQVHNTGVEIGDDQLRISGDRRNTRKRCESEQTARLRGQ